MQSLAITNDWDILIDDNGNFSFVEGNEELLQAACHAVYTFKGEDPFNSNMGIPFFEEILNKNNAINNTKFMVLFDSYMKYEIRDIEGISNIYILNSDEDETIYQRLSRDFKKTVGITINENNGNIYE